MNVLMRICTRIAVNLLAEGKQYDLLSDRRHVFLSRWTHITMHVVARKHFTFFTF